MNIALIKCLINAVTPKMYMLAVTLQYTYRQGLIVACMPGLAELPIITLVAIGMTSGALPARLLYSINIAGGLVLLWMGYIFVSSSTGALTRIYFGL